MNIETAPVCVEIKSHKEEEEEEKYYFGRFGNSGIHL
jgi:hypothetical protein